MFFLIASSPSFVRGGIKLAVLKPQSPPSSTPLPIERIQIPEKSRRSNSPVPERPVPPSCNMHAEATVGAASEKQATSTAAASRVIDRFRIFEVLSWLKNF
jgi:hypothetical protein